MSTIPKGRRDPLNIPGVVVAAEIEPLLTIDGVARVLAVGRSTIERMRAGGKLPRPDVHVGRRSPRWRVQTIDEWVASGGKAVGA